MTNFNDQLIDQLLEGYEKPEDLIGEKGILKQLTKRLLERALSAEMDHHLGYKKNAVEGRNTGNSRNGHTAKRVKGDFGEIDIHSPRDRMGSFQPQILEKRQTRFNGFDDKIISLYSRGLSTREIQGHLADIYGVDVSPTLISDITSAVMDDVRQWQNRPLDGVYPIVYFDAMRVKIRAEGRVLNKSVYLAMGINREGRKELLGMWIQQTEGAKFWLNILTELKSRGVKDFFVACIDGLSGFPEAIRTAFPNTQIQLCIVHMVRNSLKYVSWKNRKAVAADLRNIYTQPTAEQARAMLEVFAKKWDSKYAAISQSWVRHWPDLVTFFDYPEQIRKVLYTTNPMESINATFRKVIKTRRVFPNDDAVRKIFYLALNKISTKWSMPIRDWKSALNHFLILFGDRLPLF